MLLLEVSAVFLLSPVLYSWSHAHWLFCRSVSVVSGEHFRTLRERETGVPIIEILDQLIPKGLIQKPWCFPGKYCTPFDNVISQCVHLEIEKFLYS